MVENKQNEGNLKYLKRRSNKKIVRTELILAPLLITLPLIIGFLLIYDWYTRDYLLGELELIGELMLGVIIITGNIIFDIPFIRTLKGVFQKND